MFSFGCLTASASALSSLKGVDGEPLVYPVPLFIRNTFIDAALERLPSFEDFFQERKVRSCPTSAINAPQSAVDGVPSQSLPHQITEEPRLLAIYPDTDSGSECSTADTLEQEVRRSRAAARIMPMMCMDQQMFQEPAVQGFVLLDLPSLGSAGHMLGQCKPCAFFTTKGCGNGLQCPFCHLCDPGEKKRRRKDRLQVKSVVNQISRIVAPWNLVRSSSAASSYPDGSCAGGRASTLAL